MFASRLPGALEARAGLRRLRLPGKGLFLAAPRVSAEVLDSLLEAHRGNVDPARVLKKNRGTLVTRVTSIAPGAAGEWVVKEAPLPWRRRIYHLAGGPSRLAGEFQRVERLAALNVDAPRPLAASLRPSGRCEYLITELIVGARTLRDLLWMGSEPIEDIRARKSLLEGAGAWLRGLHDLGVWQRDMKPGNVLVTGWGEGEGPRFHLVDIDGVRILGRPLSESRRARNLGQMLDLPARLDDEAGEALLAAYAGGEAPFRDRLRPRASAALEERRRERERRTGARYVDEEVAE